MPADIIDQILAENVVRLKRLGADYNPVTGEGLAELLGEKRVKLSIPDFAIPLQWVPEPMMQVPLVKGIVRAGGICKYIDRHRWRYSKPEPLDIERRLRRIRHTYDFAHWAFFCIRIQDKTSGGFIRYRLNYPQLLTLKQCEQMRREGIPIDVILLKARQWGIWQNTVKTCNIAVYF